MMNPMLMGFPFLPNPSVPLDSVELSRMVRLFRDGHQLSVVRIEYASPGFKDLGGVGVVVGHMKDFIIELLDRYLNRNQRKLNDDALRIENARKYVQLAKEMGYTDAEIRGMIRFVDDRQETLVKLIEDGKIKK